MKKPHNAKCPSGEQAHDESKGSPDPVIEEAIGRQLRKLYDEVASEPVPDRFADLLKQLEQQQSGKG